MYILIFPILIKRRHYIPINEDLSNLREMYDWAEANPERAQQISQEGTEYVKSQATHEVMKANYERYFVHALKRVVDAYLPIEKADVKTQMNDWLSNWTLIGKCSGRDEKCKLKYWKIEE